MKKTLWVLTDNRAGSVSQARGIVQQLNLNHFDVTEKEVEYTKLSGLPNFIRARSLMGLTKKSQALFVPPFPDYVISVSRRTVPVARFIKKQNPKTKLIQLMHPGTTGLSEFSLVLVPEHDKDKVSCKNMRYMIGAPHSMTPDVLDEAKKRWEKQFKKLPKPLTAVVIGGAIKDKPFSEENARELGKKIKEFKETTGGSILITTSRRTGEKAQKIIMEALKDIPAHTFLWGEEKENPYRGYLACADQIIVTGDSVSMVSEACGTDKPVFVFEGKNWLTAKHHRFIDSLYKNCYAVPLDKRYINFRPNGALNAAFDAAREIERL